MKTHHESGMPLPKIDKVDALGNLILNRLDTLIATYGESSPQDNYDRGRRDGLEEAQAIVWAFLKYWREQ